MGSLLDVGLPRRRVRQLGGVLLVVGLGLSFGTLQLWVAAQSPPEQVEREVVPHSGMLALPAGTFLMGSPSDEEVLLDETQHEVRLSRPFLIGLTEVTQAQYKAVLGEGRLYRRDDFFGDSCQAPGEGDDLPVVCATWREAVEFANAVSRLEGLPVAYRIDSDGSVEWDRSSVGYRLPTEAEWEYAARATTQTRYVGTDTADQVCDYGNVRDSDFPCSDGVDGLADVGAYEANPWGLLGFGGNVSEWVWDWAADFTSESTTDPTGPDVGTYRVIRGASWRHDRRDARVAPRSGGVPGGRHDGVGFRLARSCYPSALSPSDCLRAPQAAL